MTKTFETEIELLEFVRDGGVSSVLAQGYHWFWDDLVPTLEKLAAKGGVDTELMADCYYVTGDVHDLTNAPSRAIGEYKKAMYFDPEGSAPYREIANMLHSMGEFKAALHYSDEAISRDPDDQHTISDRKEIEEDIKDPHAVALFEQGDPVWEAYELLAKPDPEAALARLKGRRGIEAMKARLCCFGVMKNAKDCLKRWQLTTSRNEPIWFDYADWFFMADDGYEGFEFWRILHESKTEMDGVFVVFDSLKESQRYSALSWTEGIRLRAEFIMYENSHDLKGLKRLHKDYPEWKELSESIKSQE